MCGNIEIEIKKEVKEDFKNLEEIINDLKKQRNFFAKIAKSLLKIIEEKIEY